MQMLQVLLIRRMKRIFQSGKNQGVIIQMEFYSVRWNHLWTFPHMYISYIIVQKYLAIWSLSSLIKYFSQMYFHYRFVQFNEINITNWCQSVTINWYFTSSNVLRDANSILQNLIVTLISTEKEVNLKYNLH